MCVCVKCCLHTHNEFLENVDGVAADHRSIETDYFWVFQSTPDSELVCLKVKNVYLINRQKHISMFYLQISGRVQFTYL